MGGRHADEGQTRGRAGARAAALKKARDAKRRSDLARLAREQAVEGALADYYLAKETVNRTRARAQRRAREIIEEAEDMIREPVAQTEEALRRLRELGETRSWIKEVTGVTGSDLYGALAPMRAAPDTPSTTGETAAVSVEPQAGPGSTIDQDSSSPIPGESMTGQGTKS